MQRQPIALTRLKLSYRSSNTRLAVARFLRERLTMTGARLPTAPYAEPVRLLYRHYRRQLAVLRSTLHEQLKASAVDVKMLS